MPAHSKKKKNMKKKGYSKMQAGGVAGMKKKGFAKMKAGGAAGMKKKGYAKGGAIKKMRRGGRA